LGIAIVELCKQLVDLINQLVGFILFQRSGGHKLLY
jgi:hypothetical protein